MTLQLWNFASGKLRKIDSPALWRNSGGRRQFRVTIARLVLGSIPGCNLRERNFGGVQNHTKECTGVSEMITLHQYNMDLA